MQAACGDRNDLETEGPYNQDRIFAGPSADRTVQRNNGVQLMLPLAKDAHGYAGSFDIGLELS